MSQSNSAFVSSDDTFVLYPLPTFSSSPSTYDVVIHGPGHGPDHHQERVSDRGRSEFSRRPFLHRRVVARAVGTYNVNLKSTAPPPAGATIGFYQTLPATAEVPYLIEERPIDPFSRTFASDQAISDATLILRSSHPVPTLH